MVYFTYILLLNLIILLNCQTKERTMKVLSKTSSEKQAIKIIKDLIYNNITFEEDTFLLDFSMERNWPNLYKIALEFTSSFNSTTIINNVNSFIDKERDIIGEFNNILKNEKKRDIIRISPIFEWSQNDEQIKIRLKFAKSLETPGEKEIKNFKVNCTRSQLEIQGYKDHDDYIVHYYRRLNLFEFIRPSTCTSYKETDGTYIVHFDKNQYTLYWNFLNQPTEDHYNTYTWFDVFSKYDNKIQYTEFRETAMENLLLSDLEEYTKEDNAAKRKRQRRITKALAFLETKDQTNKNYCLSPANIDHCNMPSVNSWGFWQV